MPACMICEEIFTGRGRSKRCETCVGKRSCMQCKRDGVTTGTAPRCYGCYAKVRRCRTCGAHFSGSKSNCNRCRVQKDREARRRQGYRWRAATGNNERQRWRHIEHKYGLTRERYEEILAEQGNRCAACPAEAPGGRWNNWHVDHDHACCPNSYTCGRCVRGLLCGNCNLALGAVADDPARLQQLLEYLQRTRATGRAKGGRGVV